ncbi:MAG: phage tail tape measure protein, partial [Candidatus Nanopelagicales bacterium]
MADTIISVGGETTLLEKNIRAALSKDFKLTGFDAKSFTQPLGKIKGQLGEFEKSLEASNARVVAFGASAGSIYLLTDAFKSMVKSTIEVEKTLADINTILNVSERDIKSFGDTLFNVANKTSQSFQTTAEAALEFSRQGLTLEQTAKRTADALTLAKLSGLSAAASVEALTAAINSFSDAGLTTAQIVNKLAAVDARYAVSSADLAEAIKRVGSSASEAGVNLDQLIALVTSAQQTTARGGAVIGNSFKTIFTRLQRPKVLDDLRDLGINTTNAYGQTLPLVQILTQLAKTFDNLGDSQKSQVAELVGGVYQINILKAVLGDLTKGYSTYSGALKASSGASNEAEQRIGKLAETIDSQVNRVTNNLKRAGSVIGDLTIAPALEKVLSKANSVLETFSLGKEPETFGEKAATGFLKGLGSFIAGPGLLIAAAGAFKIFQRLAVFVGDAGKTILGLGQAAQQQAQIQAQILNILQRNPQLYAQIESGAVSVQSAAQAYLNIVNATNIALEKQKSISSQIAASAIMGGATVSSKGTVSTKGRKGAAGGFIPSSTVMSERLGAMAGGYKPGKVVKSPVGGVMNTAEDVKYVPGFSQPFINPPAGSKAGRQHKQNSIKQTGVDPYAYGGFIPNFADKVVGEILGIKDGDTITGLPLSPKSVDYRLANVDAPEKNQKFSDAATSVLASYYKENGLNRLNEKINAAKAARNRGVFDDRAVAQNLVSQGLGVPDFRYTRDTSLLTTTIKARNASLGIWSDSYTIGKTKYYLHPKAKQFQQQKESVGLELRYTKDKKDVFRKAKTGEEIIKNRKFFDALTYKGTRAAYKFEGFVPNFAEGDGSLSLEDYMVSKYGAVQPLNSLGGAALNAAYKKGVSLNEIREKMVTISNKWETWTPGGAAKAQTEGRAEARKKAQVNRANKYGYRKIILPWSKTVADFGGDPNDFGDAYENLVAQKFGAKRGERFKRANDYPGIAGRNPQSKYNYTDVDFIVPKNPNDLSLGGSLIEARGGDKKNYNASDISKKFDNFFKNNPSFDSSKWNRILVSRNSDGFIPNFAGKEISTKFFRTKTGFGEPFSKEGGTGLSGTVYRQPGFKSYGYQLKEQLN